MRRNLAIGRHNVGEMLRECRERAGMTQQQLAAMLHIDRSTVAKVETGIIKEPSYTLVRQWCAATQGLDLMQLDLAGSVDGWKKLRKLEETVRKLKMTMDAVNLRRKLEAKEHVGIRQPHAGSIRGRL